MMKLSVGKATVNVDLDYFLKGSVLKNTVDSGCSAARTHFIVNSDEPREKIEQLIKNAKQGCFAEKMLQAAVPLTSTIELNGENFSI
tara:strand:- start:447 stop:707 length:261 start_codon:yes stop_codon:yes gene_type:complete